MTELFTEKPNYKLSKTVLEQSPVSKTFNILNSKTKQLWRAKVFDLQKIKEKKMIDVLEYNEEVFYFLKEKYSNSLFLQSFFEKNDKQFLVFEYWDKRLSTFIKENPSGFKDRLEVKRILQDIFLSICDIYAEDFMIINLRPEHIVRVAQPAPGSLGWKIQSLVFEQTSYGLSEECEYQFDERWSSNEQKAKRQNLSNQQKDEQIVWYFGILALRLVYGNNFRVNEKFKDSDLNLTQLKENCLPQVYELVQKSVRAKLKDRISLSSFFNLSIFSQINVNIEGKKKIVSGFSERIKKSMVVKSSILQKSTIRMMQLQSKIRISEASNIKKTVSKTLKSLTQNQASRIFQQLRWVLQKCLYLAEIKDYTQKAASINETTDEDKTVIRYLYFKIAEINFTQFKQALEKSPSFKTFRESASSQDYYNELIEKLQQNQTSKQKKSILQESEGYAKKMKILDPNKLKLLQTLKQEVSNLKKSIRSSEIVIEELIDCFITVNGKFFSILKKTMEKVSIGSKIQNRGIKIRALCYFILSSYVVLAKPLEGSSDSNLVWLLKNDFQIYKNKFYEEQRLRGSIHVKFMIEAEFIRLCEFTYRGVEEALVQNSQKILRKYFMILE